MMSVLLSLLLTLRGSARSHAALQNESGLRRVLNAYLEYYLRSRTHLALDKDPPIPRAVMGAERGPVIALAQVGGLHHRYERRAA